MKFDILSDPHLDIWDIRANESAFDFQKYKNSDSDAIIVAGDISNYENYLIPFFTKCLENYKFVYVVDGNHDHYMRNYKNSIKSFKNIEKILNRTFADKTNKRFFFLHGDTDYSIHGNLAIIGVNGWYDWSGMENYGISKSVCHSAWMTYSNDSRHIDFDNKYPDTLAAVDMEKLKSTMNKINNIDSIEKVIVVTHTAPLPELLRFIPENPLWNNLSGSYTNSLMKDVIKEDINKKIKYWVYGHTHERKMTDVDYITYINNSRGYPTEIPNWQMIQIEV